MMPLLKIRILSILLVALLPGLTLGQWNPETGQTLGSPPNSVNEDETYVADNGRVGAALDSISLHKEKQCDRVCATAAAETGWLQVCPTMGSKCAGCEACQPKCGNGCAPMAKDTGWPNLCVNLWPRDCGGCKECYATTTTVTTSPRRQATTTARNARLDKQELVEEMTESMSSNFKNEKKVARKAALEKASAEKAAAKKAVAEQAKAEKIVAEKAAAQKAAEEKIVQEKAAAKAEQIVAEKAAAQKAAEEKVVQEKAAAKAEKIVAEKAAAQKAAEEKVVQEKAAAKAEKIAAEKAAAQKVAEEKVVQEKAAAKAEKIAAEKVAAQKAAEEKVVQEKAAAEAEKIVAEKAAAQKAAEEKVVQEKAAAKAKEAKESCESPVKQLKELTAKLQAAEEQNKVLKKQIAASGEVSYVSAQAIVDSLGYVADAALGKETLNVDLTPVHTAADASYAAFQAAGQQATAAASKGYAASTEAYGSASKIAQDLYGQHVSQHTGEYYDAAMDAYTSHMASHVGTVRKAYNDNLHSHVNTATETLFAGYGAALEGSKTISPKVWDVVTMVKQSVPSAGVGKQLAFLVQLQTFTVPGLGKEMTLNHGYLDAALMLVQALIAAYVGVIFIWRLFLKSVVWNIGIKLLGREVCLRLSVNLIKVSLKLARFFVSLALSLVLTVFSWALCWFILGAFGVLGVVLLHAFETGLKVGLKPGMRLALGLCFGLLFGFIFQCKFCKKRKAKAPESMGKATNTKNSMPKTAAKKTEPDAKNAPKPTKKK